MHRGGIVATEINRALFSKKKSEPKSVLGFYAIVIGILFAGSVAASSALAWSDTDTWLIPWILGFSALFLIVLVVGVFFVMLRDPSKLMLTHVTGDEFLAIQSHHTLGDSLTGQETSLLLRPVIAEIVDVPVEQSSGRTDVVIEGEH